MGPSLRTDTETGTSDNMIDDSIARHRGRAQNPTIVDLLPTDMLTEVISQVAASSFTDLINVKLSCKRFNEVADDKLVYERVSLSEFLWPLLDENTGFKRGPRNIFFPHCSEKASAFLNMCKECGNTQVLYEEGMQEYFQGTTPENGEESLKRAAELGHIGASYVLGVLLTCGGEEERKEKGMGILKGIKRSKSMRRRVIDVRRNLPSPRVWWAANADILRNWPKCCGAWDEHKQKEEGRSEESGAEEYLWCDECWCDRQVSYLIHKFYSIRCFTDIIPPIHLRG